MRRGWPVAALAAALLVLTGCSEGDPDVLGVQVERTPSDTPTPASPTPPTSPTPSPEEPDEPEGTPTTEAPPAETTAPAPPPETTEPPPPAQTQQPDPTPAPEPVALAAGEGNTFAWTPREEPAADGTWWTETSSLPPQSRDAETWNGQRVQLRDAEGDGGQVRLAACDASIVAPDDRPVDVDGTVTATVWIEDQATTATSFLVDRQVPAGEVLALGTTEPRRVDAADGHQVSCTIEYQPA